MLDLCSVIALVTVAVNYAAHRWILRRFERRWQMPPLSACDMLVCEALLKLDKGERFVPPGVVVRSWREFTRGGVPYRLTIERAPEVVDG